MSTLIRVEHGCRASVGLILQDVGNALHFILGLAGEPEVMAVERYEPEQVLPESLRLAPGEEQLIRIKVKGERAVVSVSTHQGRDYVYVSPDGWRTELEHALAAAVAVALAERSGSEITDSALAFTSEFSRTAEEFAQALKIEGPNYDVNEAAREFFARLWWQKK